MQKKNTTVHLLILDPSQNDAESMVSLLRNSGKATRAHRITSEEDLEETLKSGQWDLLLARDDVEQEFDPDGALAMIRRMDKDIPFVLLTSAFSHERAVAIMKAGGQDTVPFDNTDQLVLVVNRELSALEDRRRRRTLESHLRESEQRCQLLLESSKDAIAYINDGMHIYANQSYMEFLGYDDIDDLICIPVLDTLTSESAGKYKEFMKAFTGQDDEGKMLTCVARRSDDQELNVNMTVSAATYDGELCTQIVLQPEQNDAELEEKLRQISSQDLLTGLFNRHYLMDALGKTIANAGKDNETGALAYISIDSFMTMKSQVGIAGADLMLGDLAKLLGEQTPEGYTLARLSDDAFCLLSHPCEEKAMADTCEAMRKRVEDHLFDINGRTVQITLSMGVAAITENAPKAPDLMGRAHTASSELKKKEGHEHGNGVLVYNPADYESLDENHSADAIQKALDDNRFRLLFQPIINLRGEGEEHYEAFVRMLDKDDE